jgi:hypothetical protein
MFYLRDKALRTVIAEHGGMQNRSVVPSAEGSRRMR